MLKKRHSSSKSMGYKNVVPACDPHKGMPQCRNKADNTHVFHVSMFWNGYQVIKLNKF